MILHLKLELDVDTKTGETSKIERKVTMLDEAHLCRRPGCPNACLIDRKYCSVECFRTHGDRGGKGIRSRSKIPHLDMDALKPVLDVVDVCPSDPPATTVAPRQIEAPARKAGDYRQFTFPQGGLA